MSAVWQSVQGLLPLMMMGATVYMVLGLLNSKRPLDSLLAAGIVGGGIICLLTEILSSFQLLSLSGLFLGHTALLAGILFLWLKRGVPRPRFFSNFRAFWDCHFQSQPLLQIMALAVVVILAASLFVAIYSPPNNADSMTYHMARVGYWRQHGTLEHYYANVERQNSFSPGAEILILWTVLLSGSDRWANSIQYLSFLGSLLAVYAIARCLGFGRQQSMFAMLAAATVPTFILEATSTQNDLVMAYFLISSIYFLMNWLEDKRPASLILSCWAGGLSVLVKSSSGIYLPFFALAVLAGSVPLKQRIISVVTWGICLTVFVVVTSGPFIVRNLNSYGSPTGPTYYHLNQTFSLRGLLGNAYRNIALHIEFPPVPKNLPEMADLWSSRFSQKLGVDLNDPTTTWPGTRFHFKTFRPHEDRAGIGIPMLVLLLIGGGIFVSSLWKGLLDARTLAYLVILLLSGLSFIAIFRWNFWHTRLHVPLVLLSCPLLAILHQNTVFKSIRQICLSYIILGSMVLGLISALFNYSRPLLPIASMPSILQMSRTKIMYINRPWMQCIYGQALRLQPDVQRIGIHGGPDSYEYPLFGKHFERMLFPLPEDVFSDANALSRTFNENGIALVISQIVPRYNSGRFKVEPLPVDCPESTWPEAWRKSAIRDGEHLRALLTDSTGNVYEAAEDRWFIVWKRTK